MKKMNDFEIRANNIKTAIESASFRVDQFGYSEDATKETVSRVVGMFITWLTACEEARQQYIQANATFTKNVINMLPTSDDTGWDTYIIPPPSSTLRQRAEALWGIRVAFTHADSDISLITNTKNQHYASNSPNIFNSVTLQGNKLQLNEGLYHEAIKTIVQIRDVLP